jgi:hypothetical protein
LRFHRVSGWPVYPRTAGLARLGLVDLQVRHEVGAFRLRRPRRRRVVHLDEAEAAEATGLTIHDEFADETSP